MNFLAHLYLSGTNEKVKVGNFIGDFVKGNQISQYDPDIQKGIRLHRGIDAFTDSHSVVLESKKRLRSKFRHYAPVIVDIFYDHFLAKKWSHYSEIDLKKYTTDFYRMISKYAEVIPDAVNNMLVFMKRKNWLYNYQFLEGIDQALKGMSKRTKFDSQMEYATKSLEENYDAFEAEFDRFFPELEAHVKKMIE